MKKIVMTLVFLFSIGFSFAQKETKVIEKNGVTEVTFYYDNGNIKQHGFFNKEGNVDGKWTMYNVEGKKSAVGNYDNGVKVGKWFFWSQDNTLTEVDYKESKVDKVNVWKRSTIASRE